MKLTADMSVLVLEDGTVQEITRPTLEEAKQMVRGNIDFFPFERDGVQAQALLNYDGLSQKLKPNRIGMHLLDCVVFGPMIVLTGSKKWTEAEASASVVPKVRPRSLGRL